MEEALRILVDDHGLYLWREKGKGWGFSYGNHHRPDVSKLCPTVREAILDEIAKLREKADDSAQVIASIHKDLATFRTQADELEEALKP